jgi:uncharacterized protein
MTVSGLYVGEVSHRRLKPKIHALRYRIFNLYLDLDEAGALSARSRLFGFNRRALLSFHERDHGDGSGVPLKAQIEARVRRAGFAAGGPVRVMALPRVLGYAFNPITLFFCHDEQGSLTAVVHQVNNTFGQRRFYVLPAPAEGVIDQTAAKSLHVSPFMAMDHRYDFRLIEPGDHFVLGIRVMRGDDLWLSAAFDARRREFRDAELLKAWLAHPLLTLKVTSGIHLEALKIWLKGVKLQRAPKPDSETLVVRRLR